MVEQYDIAVIGAGPGGYVAAIRAAQLGFKTVCIDKRLTLGGTCLNVGCIPSKTLLQSTELLTHFKKQGKESGLECKELTINFPQMMDRKRKIVKSLVDGVEGLFRQNKISTKQGTAQFLDPHRLEIKNEKGSEEIEASFIIIATGSEAISLPSIPFDEKQIVSSTGALSLAKIPKRLIVVGAGVIGVELASVYRRLGSQVIVVEMLDRICPGIDQALSHQLLLSLQKQEIEFLLKAEVVTAVVQPEEVILTINHQEQLKNLSGDIVLVAVGRRPFTENLQLEKIGIQKDRRGFILVDSQFRTSQPNIFAIGDTIEGAMLAHRASAEGIAVVDSLKGMFSPVNYLSVPNVIYTHPEVASVGLSEAEAKEADLQLMIGKSFFKGNARARCSGETEGFVKVVGDKESGRLLGMHIIGPHASELIAEGMLAIQNKSSIKEISQAPQAHPTLSEAIKEAALDALGEAIHQ